MAISSLVGTRVKRREDPRLITGSASYVDDMTLPGMLHLAVVRSPYAHAHIKSIDTSAAKGLAGVKAVYTAEDFKDVGHIPVGVNLAGKLSAYHGVLASGKVRFVGDPVAVVVASDRYLARDAADLVKVDYAPLPAVVNMEKAMEPGSPLLYEEFGTNVAFSSTSPTEATDEAFTKADVVVKGRLVNQRMLPLPMEGRGALAQYHKGEQSLTIWTSTQSPHINRHRLAEQIGIPDHKVRMVAPEVGGGFGSKIGLYAEEALVSLISMKLGKPVKWTETRSENIQATIHGRDLINYFEIAATKDGKVLGLKVKVLSDLGSYLQYFTDVIAVAFFLPMMSGCYDIPAISHEIHTIYTNKTPTDAIRGAGRPEAAYMIERAMDMLAAELKMDPAEIRRRNFIAPDKFPYKSAAGPVYDTGNYEPTLDKALKLVGYEELRKKQEELRKQGRYMGIGVSNYVEIGALGPKGSTPDGAYDSARVRVERDGAVTIAVGVSPHGQGQETTFSQLAADELGVPIDSIVVIHGDTSNTPEGRGTYGSRGTPIGAVAVHKSLQRVKEKAKQIAAHLLEANVADVQYEDGKLFVAGSPQKSFTLKDIAGAIYAPNALPYDIEGGLESTSFFEPESCTFPFGTHIVVVEVDPETGEVDLQRYVAVDDCGNRLSPLLIDGQVHGGIAFAVGQALYEEVVYDENGQNLTGTLMDYAAPIATLMPSFELDHTITPTHVNPLGVKSIGESGTIGATPAVVNAVVDALSPLGVRNIDMPLKSERLWKIIHSKGETETTAPPKAGHHTAP